MINLEVEVKKVENYKKWKEKNEYYSRKQY